MLYLSNAPLTKRNRSLKVYFGLQLKEVDRAISIQHCSNPLNLIELGTDGDNGILPVVLVTHDMMDQTGFILPALHGVSLANSSALDLFASLLMLAQKSTFDLVSFVYNTLLMILACLWIGFTVNSVVTRCKTW